MKKLLSNSELNRVWKIMLVIIIKINNYNKFPDSVNKSKFIHDMEIK